MSNTADYARLEKVLTELLQRIQPSLTYRQALLGNGAGVVSVPTRTNYSYVRVFSADSKLLEIFNHNVDGYDGMPVIIGEYPWQPGFTQVLDVDWRIFASSQTAWPQYYLPKHGLTHHSQSTDPADIDKNNLRELNMHPYPLSGSWWIEVNPDYYMYGTGREYFSGDRMDLSGYASGNAHYITVYIDGATNSLKAINGSDVPPDDFYPGGYGVTGSSNPFAYFPTPPIGSIIAGTVTYTTGSAGVTITGIFPDRLWWVPLGLGGIIDSMPASTQVGQTLFNVSGTHFTANSPLVGNDGGWLTNEDGVLLVVG